MSGPPPDNDGPQNVELQSLERRASQTAAESSEETPSLELAERNQKVKKMKLPRLWVVEILSLIGALILFFAILGILLQFNNNKRPVWKYSMNLNSLIALLSTLFKALMMTAVAEAISQCKWMWYQKPHSMDQLGVFDNASRGAWGSLVLMVKFPKNYLALLGAFITIISIGINTFTQQSIQTYPCSKPVPGEQAAIPVAKYVGIGTSIDVSILDSAGRTGLNIRMATRILNSLANTNATLDVPTTCPTGNCTFDDNGGRYHSTGYCHQCWNSASDLKDLSAGEFTGWSQLPNGATVGKIDSVTKTALNVSTSAPLSWLPAARDSSFSDVFSASEIGMTILSTSYLPCNGTGGHQNSSSSYPDCYVAASCIVYPCLKRYTGRIENGRLIENIEATSPIGKDDPNSFAANSRGVAWPCVADGETYDAKNISTATSKQHKSLQRIRFLDGTVAQVPLECVYTMEYGYRNAITSYLKSLRGACVEIRAQRSSLSCILSNSSNQDVELFSNAGNATYQTVDASLERITRAITNRMREIGVQSNSGDNLPSIVTGTARQTFVCTRFEWYWLLMPALLLLATGLLLAAVALGGLFHRQDHPIWKSSVLPLLLRGPHSVGDESGKVGDKLEELTKDAERKVVVLRKEEGDTWRLLQEIDTVRSRRTSRESSRPSSVQSAEGPLPGNGLRANNEAS